MNGVLYYRRRVHVDTWHWREECRWYPKDGTGFHQRGMKPTEGELCNFCLALDRRDRRAKAEAGSSNVVMLWGAVSAILVSLWAQGILLAQTAVNIDVALILTALTPLVVATGAIVQVYFARKAKAIAEETHVLVNDQMTREKENRLFEMQLSRVTLARLVHDSAQPEEQAALDTLDKRIVALQAEIVARDAIAGTLPSSTAKAN